jgi:hypothetical protein
LGSVEKAHRMTTLNEWPMNVYQMMRLQVGTVTLTIWPLPATVDDSGNGANHFLSLGSKPESINTPGRMHRRFKM